MRKVTITNDSSHEIYIRANRLIVREKHGQQRTFDMHPSIAFKIQKGIEQLETERKRYARSMGITSIEFSDGTREEF